MMPNRKVKMVLRELIRKIYVNDISHPILQELDSCILSINPQLTPNKRYNIICDFLQKIAKTSDEIE